MARKTSSVVLITVAVASIIMSWVPHIESQTCSVTCSEGGVSVILGGNQIACAKPSAINQALCLDSHEVNYTSVLNPAACDPACANGGACVQYFVGETSGAYCVCPAPWQGPTCQKNATQDCSCSTSPCANTCASTTCYNGGSCIMVNGAPQCFCSSGLSISSLFLLVLIQKSFLAQSTKKFAQNFNLDQTANQKQNFFFLFNFDKKDLLVRTVTNT